MTKSKNSCLPCFITQAIRFVYHCAGTQTTFLFIAKKKILISPCLYPLAVETLKSSFFLTTFYTWKTVLSPYSLLFSRPNIPPFPIPNKSSLKRFALSHLCVKFQICKNKENKGDKQKVTVRNSGQHINLKTKLSFFGSIGTQIYLNY